MVLGTGVVLGSHLFPDVPDTNQFHDDITWMYENGITHGYANGNFGPRDVVNRQQMAAFMHRFYLAFPPIPGPEGPQGRARYARRPAWSRGPRSWSRGPGLVPRARLVPQARLAP